MKSILFAFSISFILSCSANKQRNIESDIDFTNCKVTIDSDYAQVAKYNHLNIVSMVTTDSILKDYLYKCIYENLQKACISNRQYYPESIVLGHLEEDTIVGCFDGMEIDTLYVDSEDCGCKNTSCKHAQDYETIKYYLVSKSGKLPKIRLFAADHMPPRIVYEGDLDGDGKSEIGYMYTWVTSQWRCYRIFSFHKNEWRYLVDPNEEYMVTSRAFRLSGHEIAERGKEKGTVLFHYLPDGLNQNVCDTIVRPTYVKIDDI